MATSTTATSSILADTAFAGVASPSSARKVQNTTATARRDAKPYQQNLLSRLLATLIEARQRQAEREVARYLATTGGKFTDQVEREIQRRLM